MPASSRIGHVQFEVADIPRALGLRGDLSGFAVTRETRPGAVFLSAGGYHHRIALNTWESARGRPPPAHHPALFHVAVLHPDRASLADALRRVLRGSRRRASRTMG